MRTIDLFGRCGILLLMVAGIVLPASAVLLQTGDAQIRGSGDSISVPLILDGVPAGLSGYNLTVMVTNPAVAEIVEIVYPDWAGIHGNSSLPSSTVWIKAVDLGDKVKSDDRNVLLGSVILCGKTEGSTPVSVIVDRMDDDSGNVITTDTRQGMVTVGSGAAPASFQFESIPGHVTGSAGSGNFLLDLIGQIIAFIKGLFGVR